MGPPIVCANRQIRFDLETIRPVIVADTLARTVGLAALGVSIIGTAIAYLGYARDRPRLGISMTWRSIPAPPDVPHDQVMVVSVMNLGRRPLSIRSVTVGSWGQGHARWKVRLLMKMPLAFLHARLGVPDLIFVTKPTEPIETPIVLQPAESKRFEFPKSADLIESQKDKDDHEWVSVVDIGHREERVLAPVPRRVVSHGSLKMHVSE